MFFKSKLFFNALLFLTLFFASPVFSADIFFLGESDVRTDDILKIKVILNSKESINAIEGSVIYPVENLEFLKLRDGNSLFNLWIERPQLKNNGEIFFSGIIPGGWRGNSGLIFTAEFRVKKEGLLSLSATNVRVLKNDGQGTNTKVSINPLDISIFQKTTTNTASIREEAVSSDEKKDDIEAPESFVPEIIKNDFFYDGLAVLVFATQDKAEGIDYYEVKEVNYKFLQFLFPWKKVENGNSFELKDQNLSKTIMVKAVDRSGNTRIEYLPPTNPLSWYKKIEVWFVLFIFIVPIVYFLRKLWRIWLVE